MAAGEDKLWHVPFVPLVCMILWAVLVDFRLVGFVRVDFVLVLIYIIGFTWVWVYLVDHVSIAFFCVVCLPALLLLGLQALG